MCTGKKEMIVDKEQQVRRSDLWPVKSPVRSRSWPYLLRFLRGRQSLPKDLRLWLRFPSHGRGG